MVDFMEKVVASTTFDTRSCFCWSGRTWTEIELDPQKEIEGEKRIHDS